MKELQALSVVSPGFYGLNTQESGITLSSNFASLTDNVVIDKYGRLGSRKGWAMKTTNGAAALGGNLIEFLHEHVNADGSTDILSGGNNKLFREGIAADLLDITPAGYTITANNWKAANIYDHSLIVQQDHPPLLFTRESGGPVLNLVTAHTFHGSHTPNYGVSYPRDAIAAYGRFWVHDGSTIYWSTDIADAAFPAFDGGTSGTLNIAAVLPQNVDTIVALASHNNFLIIFCEKNIVIYGGADNVLGASFLLTDVIAGVGCVSRDSIANTGNDLIFLSDTGVRSLGRLIQEKSLPMRDLTKNVRDDLLKDMAIERENKTNLDGVNAVYSEVNAFYLLSFPSTSTIYCLDMRQALEDGSARVTVWYAYSAPAMLRRKNRDILIGKENGIGLYSGYTDNLVSYRLRYFSHYLDFQSSTTLKMLKQISATVIGGSNQSFVIKAGFNYEENYISYPFLINTGEVFEYGVAKYNYGAEYAVGVVLDSIKSSVGGSGNVVQIGFEADVDGDALSVQKLDIFVKTGRTS